MNTPLPPAPVIHSVSLRTANAGRLAEFYQKLLGLVPQRDLSDGQSLSLRHPVTGELLLALLEDKSARPAPPGAPGLFHIAFLFADLDHWRTIVSRAIPLTPSFHGAADHGVSWAVYLADCDGNGLELAWDKPSDEWPWRGDRIQMASRALPLRGILLDGASNPKEAGEFSIGHLHLQVADLRVGEIYQNHLDLKVTQEDYPGAIFMARGGYHHHLAINVWSTARGVVRPENAAGLAGWEMTAGSSPSEASWREPTGALVTFRPVSGMPGNR